MNEKATFAAGCFWHIEAQFSKLNGVLSTMVGYTGGSVKKPSYEMVCTGLTGHAEAVEITYNPDIISFNDLLEIFWKIHDPTTLDRQGPDIGSQYRSAIFFHNEHQKKAALNSMEEMNNSGGFKDKIVTLIEPVRAFYKAEEYHQKYFDKKGKTSCSLPPHL